MSERRVLRFLLPVLMLAAAPDLRAQELGTVTSARRFQGEQALGVDVEYGAGHLSITPGASTSLYRATMRYDLRAFRPFTRYEDGRLKIGLEGHSMKGGDMKSGRLDLALGTRVPLDLRLKFGAARADVELGGLRVRSASIQTGASETRLSVNRVNSEPCSHLELKVGAAGFKATSLGNLNCEHVDVSGGVGDVTLDFNGAWRVDSEIDVHMGLGSLTLRVPRGLGLEVRKSGFLASFDSEGLIKRGGVYYSENWQNASNRATVKINAAFGSIRVVWVDPEARFTKAARQ